MEKPKSGVAVFFAKNNEIVVDTNVLKQAELQEYLNKVPNTKSTQYVFCFDKDLSFGCYIKNKIYIENLKVELKNNKEFFC